MANPFKKVTAYEKEELISNAFRSAAKTVEKTEITGERLEKAQQKEGIRIKTTSNYIYDKLKKTVNSFPDFEKIPKIYAELSDLIINTNVLTEDLRKIRWMANQIKKMQMKYLDSLTKCRTTNKCRDARKSFYGRVSSYLGKYRKEMKRIYVASRELRRLPDLEEIPTVIVAGLPNVGKSSLLRCITGANPKVLPYPFTTKGLMLGFRDFRFKKVQFIDTPGLLDRPLKKRNKIEMQAIVVLKHLADIVIYVFDVSETCGYSLEEQMKLYKEIKKTFRKKTIVVVNKADVEGMRELSEIKFDNIPISCETKKGINDLMLELKDYIKGV